MAAAAAAALVLPLLLLLQLLCGAHASVHEYKGTSFFQTGDAWLYRGGREGLFASTRPLSGNLTAPQNVANGMSYIRWDTGGMRFHRPAKSAALHNEFASGHTGLIQALIFEVSDRNRIGYTSPVTQYRSFCCVEELRRQTGCTPGQVIVKPKEGTQWPRVLDINFVGNDTDLSAVRNSIDVTKSGMYYLWFVICDKHLGPNTVSVTGKTVWKNPEGYLPGMMMPNMAFYGWMSLAYLVLGLLWFLQYVRFWRDILQLQNCITIVVALGMSEMATWYFDFVNFNNTGFRPVGITLLAVLLGAIRKTVSRMLILVVAMGFGVVRPTLGGLTSKVLLLGGTYLLATASLDIMGNVGAIDDLNSGERIILVLPVAVLDAVFILWIFTALSKTLALLQTKKAGHKLDLYRKFTNSLACAVLISVVWIGYEMYVKVSDQFSENWENDWMLSDFWHVLTFVLLSVICMLWSPSQNANRYAFSEEVGEDADEDTLPLTASAIKAPPADAAKDKKPVNTDVFSLDDEVEEGKLE